MRNSADGKKRAGAARIRAARRAHEKEKTERPSPFCMAECFLRGGMRWAETRTHGMRAGRAFPLS